MAVASLVTANVALVFSVLSWLRSGDVSSRMTSLARQQTDMIMHWGPLLGRLCHALHIGLPERH